MDSSKSLCRRLGLRDRPKGNNGYEERPRRRLRTGTSQHSSASSERLTGANFRQGAQQQNAFRMPKSGDNSPGKSKPEQDCRFATEPPDTSARDRNDSSMTEADASSASSGRHLKHEVTLEEEDEPIADRVAFTLEEEAREPEVDDEKDEQGAEMEEQADKPSPPRRCFSHSQMQEMIKNHAFSSGLSSYKQLRSMRAQVREQSTFNVNEKEIEAQKKEFFGRHASAFGVELSSDRDRRNWELGARGMGPRSTSEGALLRYARNTVESTTRSVYNDLKIDVRNCTMKDIRRPSFVARLDIGRISPDPTDVKSATAQAAYKVCSEGKNRRRESGLAGVGTMALKK